MHDSASINLRLWLRGLAIALIVCGFVILSGGAMAAPLRQSAIAIGASQPALTATVYRSPNCNCCAGWIEHLEAQGFEVADHLTTEMATIKQRYGVPADLESCHTALIGGYVIEGHVPADDVQRLLAEQPDVQGLTAPGMPMSAPGMDTGNDPYTVLTFDETGQTTVFQVHNF
ncbi:DUF411 domain-containing protein [Almyronema epifaneia]|uniref:DUF411 domain-containing protein n=1 Tax=Almyronema epifaneia S1 TaxID=2991925 RepID=A0ABW6IEM4_9CYAN